jgi:hypothetical protein
MVLLYLSLKSTGELVVLKFYCLCMGPDECLLPGNRLNLVESMYIENSNLSSGMIYTFHTSEQECHSNVMCNKLSVTSLKGVFLSKPNNPPVTGRNSPRCRVS